MGCCGEKRSAQIATANRRPHAGDVAAPAAGDIARPAARGGVIEIRYLETASITVRGPSTGHSYYFPGGSVRQVDARDAEALLRTGIFQRR